MAHPKEFAEGLSIGIIMDGNGRWAKNRGLPRTAGHKRGAEVFSDIADYCDELGVSSVYFYAFSTENWKRPVEEVSAIMDLLRKYLLEALEKMEKDGFRIRFFGDLEALPPELRTLCLETEETGAAVAGAKYQINVCLNYGGRAEIADACAAIAKEVRDGKISGDRVTEKMIAEHLYNPDIPDCDLVIRTSGEQRTSNFLPWEAAYAELDFVPELFPDCGRDVLWRSIDHYIHRDRRFGGVKR